MIRCTELTSFEDIELLREYLLLDLETTGENPLQDRILELGMARVTDGEIVNKASTRVNPGISIPAEVTAATGLTDADVAGGLSYRQLASSLAGLLIGKTAVAEKVHMAFVQRLLEAGGYDGELRFVDVRALTDELFDGLESLELDSLAAQFGIKQEETPRVLRDCVIRQQLLRVCQEALAEPEAAEAADGEDEESPAPAERHASRGRRTARRPARQPLSTGEIAYWAAAAACLIGALFLLPRLPGFLLLLAALVFCPIRPLRSWLGLHGARSWVFAALGAVLVLAALLFRPGGDAGKSAATQTATPPPYIILTWNEPGVYGQEVVEDPDANPPETYIAFHIPPGNYRVLNNNATAATVTIRSDTEEEEQYEEPESEFEEAILVQRNGSYTILGNKSQKITVEADQYIVLSEKAEKVIFQYLSPLPEPTEEELQQQSEEEQLPEVYAYVTGKEVRMRRSPSVDAYIMTTYDTGKEVVVLDVTGDWTHVRVDKREGYIYSKYLSDTNPLATPEPSQAPEEPSPTPEAAS